MGPNVRVSVIVDLFGSRSSAERPEGVANVDRENR